MDAVPLCTSVASSGPPTRVGFAGGASLTAAHACLPWDACMGAAHPGGFPTTDQEHRQLGRGSSSGHSLGPVSSYAVEAYGGAASLL